ncbi:hypothetical protein BH10ACI3_BH10ACI3_28370 [soil metagenome]
MMKIFAKLPVASLIIVFLFTAAAAQTKKHQQKLTGEQMITRLINSRDVPGTYGDAGLFSGELAPDLISILKLGKLAIPLMIRHLDDEREFKHTMFYGNIDGPMKIEFSTVAVDILTAIIRQEPPVFDMKCISSDDRMEDNCVMQKYFGGRHLKQNWQRLYSAGKLHYKKFEF